VPFGSAEEAALLSDYFQLPRPPDPDRPYLAPWSTKDPWQKKKYPGGGLQRLRTDASARGRVLLQSKTSPAAGRRRVPRSLPTEGCQTWQWPVALGQLSELLQCAVAAGQMPSARGAAVFDLMNRSATAWSKNAR
jgi:hypothetical protein